MANMNYYEELDLRYPEIAIAQQDIDRCNPGIIKFSVPVLTPDLPQFPEYEEKVRQKNSNIVNKNKDEVEVSDIMKMNYIHAEIPKELCALAHCTYNVLDHPTSYITSPWPHASVNAKGTVLCAGSCCGGGNSINVQGTATLSHITGLIELCPVDEGEMYRFIRKPSKWLMMFIGGDINRPVVICRLPG